MLVTVMSKRSTLLCLKALKNVLNMRAGVRLQAVAPPLLLSPCDNGKST